MGGAEQVVGALAVLEPEDVGAVVVPAAGRLVGLAGQDRGERQLLGAHVVHLLADDGLDLAEHPQAQRQPGVDARRGAADVAGADQQAVARDLGVVGVVTQRAHEQGRHAEEAASHGRKDRCGALGTANQLTPGRQPTSAPRRLPVDTAPPTPTTPRGITMRHPRPTRTLLAALDRRPRRRGGTGRPGRGEPPRPPSSSRSSSPAAPTSRSPTSRTATSSTAPAASSCPAPSPASSAGPRRLAGRHQQRRTASATSASYASRRTAAVTDVLQRHRRLHRHPLGRRHHAGLAVVRQPRSQGDHLRPCGRRPTGPCSARGASRTLRQPPRRRDADGVVVLVRTASRTFWWNSATDAVSGPLIGQADRAGEHRARPADRSTPRTPTSVGARSWCG